MNTPIDYSQLELIYPPNEGNTSLYYDRKNKTIIWRLIGLVSEKEFIETAKIGEAFLLRHLKQGELIHWLNDTSQFERVDNLDGIMTLDKILNTAVVKICTDLKTFYRVGFLKPLNPIGEIGINFYKAFTNAINNGSEKKLEIQDFDSLEKAQEWFQSPKINSVKRLSLIDKLFRGSLRIA